MRASIADPMLEFPDSQSSEQESLCAREAADSRHLMLTVRMCAATGFAFPARLAFAFRTSGAAG